jgi:hypothetical protein
LTVYIHRLLYTHNGMDQNITNVIFWRLRSGTWSCMGGWFGPFDPWTSRHIDRIVGSHSLRRPWHIYIYICVCVCVCVRCHTGNVCCPDIDCQHIFCQRSATPIQIIPFHYVSFPQLTTPLNRVLSVTLPLLCKLWRTLLHSVSHFNFRIFVTEALALGRQRRAKKTCPFT